MTDLVRAAVEQARERLFTVLRGGTQLSIAGSYDTNPDSLELWAWAKAMETASADVFDSLKCDYGTCPVTGQQALCSAWDAIERELDEIAPGPPDPPRTPPARVG